MLIAIPVLILPFQAKAQPSVITTPFRPAAVDLNFAPAPIPPDYDKDVLVPLRAAQAAAEAARLEREAQLAREAADAAQRAAQEATFAQPPQAASYGNNYTPGQCTAWVASKVRVPSSMGNATNWESGLLGAGWHYGLQAGSIGVSHAGWAGHVVYVESVAGGAVTISEMNALYGPFNVDTRAAEVGEFVWLAP